MWRGAGKTTDPCVISWPKWLEETKIFIQFAKERARCEMEIAFVRNHFMCRADLLLRLCWACGQGSDGQMPPSHEVERDHAVALNA